MGKPVPGRRRDGYGLGCCDRRPERLVRAEQVDIRGDNTTRIMHTGLKGPSSRRNDDHTCFWVVRGFTRVGVWYLSSFTTADEESLLGNIMAGDHLRFPCCVKSHLIQVRMINLRAIHSKTNDVGISDKPNYAVSRLCEPNNERRKAIVLITPYYHGARRGTRAAPRCHCSRGPARGTRSPRLHCGRRSGVVPFRDYPLA